ncbi:GNAT family N-acetyltransferase [Paenibacillus glacialis]|uniref:Acetyltransferase n=1 Tax=Paenibacillus glacialis TaxID=494026 RepID=A0A162MGN4_9BACL|nr:GNAT family N-acetyltransferase [Paenibacillus glacialis]OAB44333.1 acetyltransferase [Paenibacillus glacialis]
MEIRKFRDSDMSQIISLFYDTVHTVNKQHYTQAQLDVWAPRDEEALKLTTWKDSFNHNVTYIAEINGIIVGFADMSQEGHLDRLYIHKDFQRQGIASLLVNTLELEARRQGLLAMDTEASITAKPFFEHHGYRVTEQQVVERRGVTLSNFKMIKNL